MSVSCVKKKVNYLARPGCVILLADELSRLKLCEFIVQEARQRQKYFEAGLSGYEIE